MWECTSTQLKADVAVMCAKNENVAITLMKAAKLRYFRFPLSLTLGICVPALYKTYSSLWERTVLCQRIVSILRILVMYRCEHVMLVCIVE